MARRDPVRTIDLTQFRIVALEEAQKRQQREFRLLMLMLFALSITLGALIAYGLPT
ncbi:MAG: hypothetical protein KGL39_05615 [Patescibacteria group bacterium]|nr:hypothetical protein [Patescibacteria group bacterium]